MSQAAIVPCSKCHAEVTADREACPHCGADLPNPNSVLDELKKQNAALKAKLAEAEASIKAENDELQKKLAATAEKK